MTPSTNNTITPTSPRDTLQSSVSTVSGSPSAAKNDTMIPGDHEMKGPFVTTSRILQAIEEMKEKRQFDAANADDAPSVIGSDVSSVAGSDLAEEDFLNITNNNSTEQNLRLPLQWVFKGLSLWLEWEQFDNDLFKAVEHGSNKYGTSRIPMPHTTAIYNMRHLSIEQAIEKLDQVPSDLFTWPDLEAPKGVRCDLSVEGHPGQVCSIAWAELAYPSSPRHEVTLDRLHEFFDFPRRDPMWNPHISLAYDNPDDSVLKIQDFIAYIKQHPTLLQPRKIKAISLWSTEGKIADWKCYHRVPLGSKDE